MAFCKVEYGMVPESSTSYTYDNVYELSDSNNSMFILCVLQSYKMTDMKTLLYYHTILRNSDVATFYVC